MLHFRWLDTRSIYWLALLAAVLIKINWYLQHINNRADAIGTSAINKTAASVSRRKQNWHSKVRATESFDSGMTHYRSKGISKKSHSLHIQIFLNHSVSICLPKMKKVDYPKDENTLCHLFSQYLIFDKWVVFMVEKFMCQNERHPISYS